jgi:hypothetical protein
MALFKILGVEFSHLPTDVQLLKHYCAMLWKSYRESKEGGVTCELLCKMMRQFKQDFELKLKRKVVSKYVL